MGLMPWPFGNRRGDFDFLFAAVLSWSYERSRFNVGKKGIGSVVTCGGEMLEAVFLSFFRGDLGTFTNALSSSVALPPDSVSVSLSMRIWRTLRRALRALRLALRLALRCLADNFDYSWHICY